MQSRFATAAELETDPTKDSAAASTETYMGKGTTGSSERSGNLGRGQA